jgi:transcriptional regulator with XRE-family HTH domain
MTTYRRFKDVLAESLRDPKLRAEWDRTALAREVSIWLLRYRKDHHLTQTELAELLGWKQSAIARLESGEHEPSVSTLHHLIARLGTRARIDIQPEGVTLHFFGRRRRSQPVVIDEVRPEGSPVRWPPKRVLQPA